MSTSDTHNPRRQMTKTAVTCLALGALCLAVDQVYALFGHGVRSLAMTLMCLYPLLGGALPFLMLRMLYQNRPGRNYRAAYNLYFSGLAALTVGSFFQGILEIAGSTSSFLWSYYALGGGLTLLGLAGLVTSLMPRLSGDSQIPTERSLFP